MERTAKALDAVFLCRPVLLIPVWAFCLFGYVRGRSVYTGYGALVGWRSSQPHVLLWTAVFSLSVGCIYVINQIADIEADRNNEGFALLPHGGVSLTLAWGVAAVLAVLSVGPSLAFRPTVAVLSLAAVGIGLVYSLKPARLSGRPVADFLTNALGYGVIAFGVGWHLAGERIVSLSFLQAASPYFLLMCGGSISSTLPDLPSDREHAKTTTAVALGTMRAHLLATLLVASAVVAAVLANDPLAAVVVCATIPLYLLFMVYKGRRPMEATYKVGGTIVMLAAALFCLEFAIAAVAVFFATRFYFRRRFGVSYPSLTPASYVR
jgi:4-hydroxybenzoate polyprenyltransferase